MDRIHFNMATMPAREASLKEAVDSILPQCNSLNIYMNDWDHVPAFLMQPKIKYFRSQEHEGDLGAVGKFYNTDKERGYIFTVDDDFIYPHNYAKTLINAIEKYKRQAVVSFHGRRIKPNCTSYYRDWAEYYGCTEQLNADVQAHELGTGVMAFHSDTIKPGSGIFPYSNMDDVLLGIELQKLKIPCFVIAHNAGWIRLSALQDERYSIAQTMFFKDEFQTKIINSCNYELHPLK